MSDLPPHYSSALAPPDVDLERLLHSGKPPPKKILDELPIKEVAFGAYSYPLDWWNGINLVMGYSGRYGPSAQYKARIYMRQIQGILEASLQGMPYTTKLVFVVLKYLMFDEVTRCTAVNVVLENLKSAQTRNSMKNIAGSTAGRVTGGMFTRYAQTGGRAGKNVRKNKKIIGKLRLSNVFLVILGSLTRLVIERGHEASAVEVTMAILFGRTEQILSSDQYSILYRSVMKCKDLKIPQSEIDAHNKIIKDILNDLKVAKMNNNGS